MAIWDVSVQKLNLDAVLMVIQLQPDQILLDVLQHVQVENLAVVMIT